MVFKWTILMNIYDLSEYQLCKLKSLDPNLSFDWRELIQDIFSRLDSESQRSVYENILAPRGIYFDSNSELAYVSPATLEQTLQSIRTHNNELLALASHMSKIVCSGDKYYDAMQLADELEAIFIGFDNLNMNNLLHDHKNRKKIQVAFLYDLAKWLDTVTLKVSSGFRKLDSNMVKSYLKEAFIKQKIQGQDFRRWDSSDLSFQELTYLPSFIRNEGKKRNFFVVEGKDYWFLIGSTDEPGKNPYSFRRFLHEASSGDGSEKYIYLTHVIIKKDEMHDLQYLSHVSDTMSRFYTLDLGTPDTLLSFIKEIQELSKQYLKPLLTERLEQTGGSVETTIKDRMITYEKQVSLLILQKIPRIQMTLSTKGEQDYLFYHLDELLQKMIEGVQDFRLQPLTMYSTSSEILLIKLMAFRKLLMKSRDLILSQDLSIEERSEAMGKPLFKIKEKLNDIKVSISELDDLKSELENFLEIKEKGSFWEKIKLGRMPSYTLEDLTKEKLLITKDFFISIVRIAKSESEGVVYIEFECDEIINKNYRHYALADGQLGISRLPRILRLHEDTRRLNIEAVSQVVHENVFEANPLWCI